ncbi:hypothetical protein AnigIFM63604_009146 [Aspergillus niger]|uniref:Carboxymuconolactone decarboxylase-like domain-containing protein n=2 Tax=Aspergillus TaxID=5052 RepID=A0A370P5B6_ASPPH|nr:uncharacterized protein BO96DRAFT_414316 [Aspergillus niger CBS 101883]RDK37073.1 hypothetical protein M752DRAFT_280024 [Aspergillus phoenicis ATCC 13157]GJP93889.1 transport protein particle (TRAPP) component family protein [Aspergillus niger]PYH54046.1 hypothetical protein BO96DRAFT_414316 [Aspergillus niger CBS 101883]GLA26723.1 hypothetical protein AnigIFM63326_003891 [Aspergillus niger]GLA52297.1 hypothetical protein AnigIFM63604_009146 [Aspergillus niger]
MARNPSRLLPPSRSLQLTTSKRQFGTGASILPLLSPPRYRPLRSSLISSTPSSSPLAHRIPTFATPLRTITTSSNSAPTKMTTTLDPKYAQLFQSLESQFQTTTLPHDKWYILAISTLVANPDPERADQLYLYLTSKPEYSTPSSRQDLIRRIREALIKSVIIVGVCKPIEAILAISKLEAPEDKDYTFTRENWQCDEANHERGVAWLEKLYARNTSGTLDLFAAHKDFAWLSKEITYGLFLSDRGVLDDLDTQLVVLPAIMSQNLKIETHWHIRGTRRLGVSLEDVRVLCEGVKHVAGFYGRVLDKVPSVEEVEGDV